MLVVGFPAAAFGTNCFVLAPAEGEECVVVDPGVGVVDRLHLDRQSALRHVDQAPQQVTDHFMAARSGASRSSSGTTGSSMVR